MMKEVTMGELSKTMGEGQKVKQYHDNIGSARREEVKLGMRQQSTWGSGPGPAHLSALITP